MKTIYVSIPDIGDPELDVTVKNLFESSAHPQRIFVGIGHSIPFKNQKYIKDIKKRFGGYSRVKHEFINIYKSRGVSYGRKAAISNYNGEDFYLQIDSHTMFMDDWDELLISYLDDVVKEHGELSIITGYLPPYQYVAKDKRIFPRGRMAAYPYYVSGIEVESGLRPEIVNSWTEWYKNVPMWMMPNINHSSHYHFLTKKYELIRKICANFIFSNRKFAEDFDKILPIDCFFFEEEYVMSIEAIDLGYKLIYPNFELPLGHLYTDEFNEFYSGRPSVEFEEKSFFPIRNNFDEYIKSSQDKVKQYAEYAGLNYPEMTTLDTKFIPRREAS